MKEWFMKRSYRETAIKKKMKKVCFYREIDIEKEKWKTCAFLSKVKSLKC